MLSIKVKQNENVVKTENILNGNFSYVYSGKNFISH